jgi:hypothetical protein
VLNRKPKKRGETAEVLRGTRGADFENQGRISKGGEGMGCGCFGGGEANEERLILVKGPFCFIYVNEFAPSPEYVISLEEMRADPVSSGRVLLEATLDNNKYELTFATEAIALEFADAVQAQHSAAATGSAHQRLGHGNLATIAPSFRYAEGVALKAIAKQDGSYLDDDS